MIANVCRLILGTVECQTKLGRFAASNLPSLTFPEAQEAEMQNTEILKDSPLRREFPITVWPNATSPQGERKMASVTGLIRKAEKHRVAWNGKEETRDAAKKKLMLYKCSEYEGNYRKGENLTHVCAVEIDIDGGLPFGESAERLKKAGIAAGLYSTPSYYIKGEAHRILVPLSKPQSVTESVKVIDRINFILGGAVTLETVSKGQGMFMGMLGNDRAVTRLIDGKFADEVLAEAESWPVNPNKSGEHGGDKRTTEDIEKAVIDGERRPNLPKLAMRYALAGDDVEAIRSKLIKLMDECGRSDSYDEYIADMDRIVGDGIRYAEKFKARKAEEAESLLSDEDVEGADLSEADPASMVDQFGLIEAFSKQFADKFRYQHDVGEWKIFDGNTWRRDDTNEAMHHARQVCKATAPRADGKALQRSMRSQSTAEAVERGARSEPALATSSESWDADPLLLGTPNEVVDLRTDKVRQGKASDLVSRSTSVPVGDASKAVRWLAFLKEALPDTDTRSHLQRWLGYILTGLTNEQKFLFIYGPSRTGKSRVVEAVAHIMNDYGLTVASSTLMSKQHDAHPEELARLDGRRYWHVSEIEKGRKWHEERIKSITGGDKIAARYMRGNTFEFDPVGKLVVVANDAPALARVDEAMRRRIDVIPFECSPAKPDKDLPAKLEAEAEHILAWMIEGCLDWQEKGLTPSHVSQAAADAYFAEHDPVEQWLMEKCVRQPHSHAPFKSLYSSYREFMSFNGWAFETETAFAKTLGTKGFANKKAREGNRRTGLRFKTVEEGLFNDII
jgi:P4 family phage/plasmid primase-like protien